MSYLSLFAFNNSVRFRVIPWPRFSFGCGYAALYYKLVELCFFSKVFGYDSAAL